jgi:glycosyltransferase involved in cell wall biosynthesis
MRVLYFSSMTVSPGSGGGNTVFNLLEPPPTGHEVFYITPKTYPSHWAPFTELRSRVCWIGLDGPFQVRGASKFSAVRKMNHSLAKRWRKSVEAEIIGHIRSKQIDVLLLCPQSVLDLTMSMDLLRNTGFPAVLWFMDNYFSDSPGAAILKDLWDRARHRFVISEAMQKYFSLSYGGECEVLNNSVALPSYIAPTRNSNSRLRIVYAGALHGYYREALSTLLQELKDLKIELDVYSHETLPAEFNGNSCLSCRHQSPIAASELIDRLRDYDVLLLLSSFSSEHRAIAETSLASKIADYLAAGRCILVFGPDYSENIRYADRYGFAEIVTSRERLRTAILGLIENPERRERLGELAYDFGRKRHDRAVNAARLWEALSQSEDSKPMERARQGGICAF